MSLIVVAMLVAIVVVFAVFGIWVMREPNDEKFEISEDEKIAISTAAGLEQLRKK